jgi:hypothetical protein
VSSLLIVESENDKLFLEWMITKLNLPINVAVPFCNEMDFKCLGGMGNLERALRELRFDEWDKIGVFLDANSVGINERITLVNQAFVSTGIDVTIEKINQLYRSKEQDVFFALGLVHIDGYGELETLLKKIKLQDSVFSDCLNSWRTCLSASGKSISTKDFDKLWVNFYIRYDTCSKDEAKQAGKKCSNKAAFQKDIWDFKHASLNDVKRFLELF